MLNVADLRHHPRFDEIRQKVLAAGSDSVDVFGGEYVGGYHIQQQPDEFAALACLLLDRCRPIDLYGEIGVAAGGTTRLMAETVGFENAVLIDDGGHPKHRHFEENARHFRHRVSLLLGDSHSPQIRRALSNLDDDRFDVVFIDGDHSYEGVKQDIELVKPYCTSATLLIFHDTRACEGVNKAFAEFSHPVAEFISDDKRLGIGVTRMEG